MEKVLFSKINSVIGVRRWGEFYISFTSQSTSLHPRMSPDPSVLLAEAWPKSCAPFLERLASGNLLEVALIWHHTFASDNASYLTFTVKKNYLVYRCFSSIYLLYFSQRHKIMWDHCQTMNMQHNFTFLILYWHGRSILNHLQRVLKCKYS